MHRSFILAGLLALSAHASAEELTATVVNSAQTTFESVDRNADQRISRTEAGTYKKLLDRFAVVDTDGDGFVNKTEFDARPSLEGFK
jgi:hypothetical protein